MLQGSVSGVSPGQVYITVPAQDGSGVMAVLNSLSSSSEYMVLQSLRLQKQCMPVKQYSLPLCSNLLMLKTKR